eukprot:4993249-Prymnesium_polylepis.2
MATQKPADDSWPRMHDRAGVGVGGASGWQARQGRTVCPSPRHESGDKGHTKCDATTGQGGLHGQRGMSRSLPARA